MKDFAALVSALKIIAQEITYQSMKTVMLGSSKRWMSANTALVIRLQAKKDEGDTSDRGTSVITRTQTRTKKPSLYRVLLLNDDYTPMEFVIHVLERFFQKDRESATRIMLHVHNHGVGECGVFTYEVAETKVTQVMDFARQHQHPLQCVMEKN